MALSNTTRQLTHHSGIPMIYHSSVEIATLPQVYLLIMFKKHSYCLIPAIFTQLKSCLRFPFIYLSKQSVIMLV